MKNEVQPGTVTHREGSMGTEGSSGDRRKHAITVMHFRSEYFDLSKSITFISAL